MAINLKDVELSPETKQKLTEQGVEIKDVKVVENKNAPLFIGRFKLKDKSNKDAVVLDLNAIEAGQKRKPILAIMRKVRGLNNVFEIFVSFKENIPVGITK